MKIPDYDDTMCPYCKLKDTCNKRKFKVKIKKDNKYNDLKYSYCKSYEYIYKEEIK